ncbi:MAG: branched-chain amino acid ABC transporter permease [Thermodesulfobacteriota bacterium]
MEYLLHILILINIYIILSVSLNLIAGYTGLLSIAHAAFYGLGAYIAALLSVHFGTNFLFNMILGMIGTAILGVIVAFPSLRIYDDYFVIATFGFQMIIYSILNNWVSLTRGPLGIPGIPEASLFGFRFDNYWKFFVLTGLFATLSFLLTNRLVNSPFGRVLKAIREDEVFAKSLGKNVTAYKIKVFIIGGAIASIAGNLYAHYVTFIDPTSFTILESILILSMVIIGGAGNLWGGVLGAVILVVLPEILRFIGMPSAVASNMRQIFYGALLVLFMLFRPQGILGEYAFRKK